MTFIRRVFDLYLSASLHVALSVYCLIRITEALLRLPPDPAMEGFGFCGTVAGYNFVKYDALARQRTPVFTLKLKIVVALSVIATAAGTCLFFYLSFLTQAIALICAGVTALYALPFFPNSRNARSWAGLKIYMVALCWVAVTVILPVVNSGFPFTADVGLISVKRFILIVVLLFIFEIIDLAWDDPHLKTVPQQIGVRQTKQLGFLLLASYCLVDLLLCDVLFSVIFTSLLPAVLTAGFLMFAHEKQSRYYTVFWTESIPVLWWITICVFNICK